MLLRNYDNLMAAKCMPANSNAKMVSTDTSAFGDGHINVLDYQNTKRGMYFSNTWANTPCSYFDPNFINVGSNLTNGASALLCGDGNTPVTYDDYKLESLFTTSQVTCPSNATQTETVYNEADGSWTTTYTRTLTALTDITVKEIGVYSGFYISASTQSKALVYRRVLDTPIEVPSGSNFILSFTTTRSANPNKPVDYDASAAILE